ncbi:MAG: PD-(D/E)XK nuclease family protein [Magnetococcus sp. DMHC-6]
MDYLNRTDQEGHLSLLWQWLEEGAVCLTVNRRLARYLTREWDRQQHRLGRVIWPTPKIYSFVGWLEQCWQSHLDGLTQSGTPVLLTEWQENLLWEEVVRGSKAGEPLLDISGTAKLAKEAWGLLKAWCLDLPDAALLDSADSLAFAGWAKDFTSRCQKLGLMDRASWMTYLAERLSLLSHPQQIILIGFDEITPQQKYVLQGLRQANISVDEWIPPPLPTVSLGRIEQPHLEGEIRAAALWAKEWLVKHAKEGEYVTARIGIVVPGLERLVRPVTRIFSEVLDPGALLPGREVFRPLFNISMGSSLSEYPLIADALLLLGLGNGWLPLSHYRRVLSSPFWQGGEEEFSQRMLLSAQLRKAGRLQVSIQQLQTMAHSGRLNDQEMASPCPQMAHVLMRFQQEVLAVDTHIRAIGYEGWSLRFSRWLSLLGWPGESRLTNGQYQIVEAWKNCLAAFAGLEPLSKEPISLQRALQQMRDLAGEMVFQPETPETPIQILGPLEAAGIRFERLWILGFSADTWPPLPKPNPFLPLGWQRQKGLPHASRERESAYAERITHRLLLSGNDIIVSHSRLNGDLPLRPSPLIAHLPVRLDVNLDFSLLHEYHQHIFQSQQLESIIDTQGPAVPEGSVMVGGSTFLQSVSNCPFQAFARYRLGGFSIQEPVLALGVQERGKLVHVGLESLWSKIPSQEFLKGMDGERWQSEASQAAQQAVRWGEEHYPELFTPAIAKLEERRLQRLLYGCLHLELTRKEPFHVVGRELNRMVRVGGLELQVRLDRVDRLSDKRFVVLDYKTGYSSLSNWFGDRPKQVQMPLYSLLGPEWIWALTILQTQAKEICFIGLARQADLLPGVKEWQQLSQTAYFKSWSALMSYWQEVLEGLVASFRMGDAHPDPLPEVCTYCDLDSFCRQHEWKPKTNQ